MGEEQKPSNVTRLHPASPKSPSQATSLEERLEQARAKRARILAAKGEAKPKPAKLSKPWLDDGQDAADEDDFDPAARLVALQPDPTPQEQPEPATEPAPDPAPPPEPEAATTTTEMPPEEVLAPDGVAAVAAPVAPRRGIRWALFAGFLGLAFGLTIAGAVVLSTLDRLPKLEETATLAETSDLAPVTTAPEPGTYLPWDPTVLRPGIDTAPVERPPDALPAVSVAEITALPERQIEASLINRLLRTSPDAALPANLTARIRIYAPASIPRDDLEEVATFLRRQGLEVGAPTPVSYPIPGNQIRYYHRTDYAAAQSLGMLMGATLIRADRVGDDTPFRGVVDIWIAGE